MIIKSTTLIGEDCTSQRPGYMDKALHVFKPLEPSAGGFIYSRTIQLSGSTTIDDETIKVVLTTSNFDYSRCKSGGGDIRFIVTSGSRSFLSYWIGSWKYGESSESVIWVKVPNAGTSLLYMVYGGSFESESSIGNIANFSDDFSGVAVGGVPDPSKWTLVYTPAKNSITVQLDPADETKKVCEINAFATGGGTPYMKSIGMNCPKGAVVVYRNRTSLLPSTGTNCNNLYVIEGATGLIDVSIYNSRFRWYKTSFNDFNPLLNASPNVWYQFLDIVLKTSYVRYLDNAIYVGGLRGTLQTAALEFRYAVNGGYIHKSYISDVYVFQYGEITSTVGSESFIESELPILVKGRLHIGRRMTVTGDRGIGSGGTVICKGIVAEQTLIYSYANEPLLIKHGSFLHHLANGTTHRALSIGEAPDYELKYSGTTNLGSISAASLIAYNDLVFIATYTAGGIGIRSYRILVDGTLLYLCSYLGGTYRKYDCLALHNNLLYASSCADNSVSTFSSDSNGVLSLIGIRPSIENPDGSILFYDNKYIVVAIDKLYLGNVAENGVLGVPDTVYSGGGGLNFCGGYVDNSNKLLFVCNGVNKTLRSFKIGAYNSLTLVQTITYTNFRPRSASVVGYQLAVVGVGSADAGIYLYDYDSEGNMTQKWYHVDSGIIDGNPDSGYAHIAKITAVLLATVVIKAGSTLMSVGVYKYLI